jgi:GNAT superfamily N-acetyltransferase
VPSQPTFRPYTSSDRATCRALFDQNCPRFFAPNERAGYEEFLDTWAAHYQVCLLDGQVVGAFGILPDPEQGHALRWIVLTPTLQGQGLGSAIMNRVLGSLKAAGVGRLSIGASHLSAPFFARFGASEIARTPHGWGPGMHRVDMVLEV